ncbi:hypothetical protein RE428_06480 [Marinobacter nanhaiticus D15-8W]|uniref:Uncharacterized protein n=1 Tax=Marinobacter nanhaiticus D15-8W TaxID=626887 RepID=N6WUK0_9GAMM|nr:hypothetical protein [Marinobacter nanhaiticus]ENO14682.1 hypothetical protein J057_05006 [Marinobacter nanhaiticus D15-8W]BES69630.1 hypothetical protein RE428_06480 [Marinobacter nanhaiticus D15-8W]
MALLIIKIAVTLATVLALAWLAERLSTRVAGVLAGFPLGTGVALFFLGYEQGPAFAADAARGTLLGFIGAQALALAFAASAGQNRIKTLVLSLLAFVVVALPLSLLDLPLWAALLASIAFTLVAHRLMRHLADTAITLKRRPGWGVHIARGVISGLIVVGITSAGYWGTAALSGVLAAFPVTFFPLLAIIFWQHGPAPAQTLVKHYPAGLGSLITHTVAVFWLYPLIGVYWGTLGALALATLWSFGWLAWQRRNALA